MTKAVAAPRRRRPYAPRMPAEQRRTQLLDAALHLVATRGHAAATIDAIAERAGVTKPVVYGLYANRGALLAALLEREQQGAMAQIVGVLPTDGFSDAALPAMLEEFLRAVRAAPQRWHCVVMPMPDMPVEFHAAREQARGAVLGQVEDLIGRVWSAEPADPEILAHSVVTLAEMAARLVLTDPERFQPERFVTALRAVLPILP